MKLRRDDLVSEKLLFKSTKRKRAPFSDALFYDPNQASKPPA
jgi:hypothetical protein